MSDIYIYLYLTVVLAIAGLVGLAFYRTSRWHLVDVFYYPLAAVGVALLFVSNTTQRALLQVDDQLQRNRLSLQALQTAKPVVDYTPGPMLVETSFSLISGIGELAEICGKVPRMDPTCSVAEKMKRSIAEFSAVVRGSHESPELRIAAACRAGEELIGKLRTNEHMSALVGDELATQFKDARQRGHFYLDYNATEREAQEFEKRATARLEELQRAFPENSESVKFVFAMNRAEIDFGKTIIHGFYPCLAVPQVSLDRLADWTINRQTQQAALAQLEVDRKRVELTPSTSRVVLWMHLNLWPLVLIAALSLKFSKGVASLRKHQEDIKATGLPHTISEVRQSPSDPTGHQKEPTSAISASMAAPALEEKLDDSAGANTRRDA